MVFRAGYGSFFDRYVSPLDASHREKRFTGVRAGRDGTAAASLFATAQGGPLVAPAFGLPHLSSDLIRAWATPIASKPVPGAEYLLAKNLTLAAPTICLFMD